MYLETDNVLEKLAREAKTIEQVKIDITNIFNCFTLFAYLISSKIDYFVQSVN